jgi:large subunit ribosomal protein L10
MPGLKEDKKRDKKEIVAELQERMKEAPSFVLAEYRGLTVKELQELRRSLKGLGASFKVYKNTLVQRAADASSIEGLSSYLQGPTALAFAGDQLPGVAKVLRDFSRSHAALVIKAGVMDGHAIDAKDVARLADLPSPEVLQGQLASVLAAPMRNLASVLQALPRNLAYALDQLSRKQAA